ncbi:MAG: dihydrofolate reductase, partial [Nanoarchaeota archaeon]
YVGSRDEALERAEGFGLGGSCFVIGGAQVYGEFLPIARKIELTEIHQRVIGDVFFPDLPSKDWKEISRMCGEGFDFVRYKSTRLL